MTRTPLLLALGLVPILATSACNAADPAAMQTALQSAADWVQQSAPELPEEIRDRLNAALEAWWASLPEDSKKQLDEFVAGVGQLTQYRLGLLQYEKGAAQLAAGPSPCSTKSISSSRRSAS